jgi:hypothetical protein
MAEFSLPILGFDQPRIVREVQVVWADGSPVCGLLGSNIGEALARRQAEEAEEAHKQSLRDSGVVLLDDWRNK